MKTFAQHTWSVRIAAAILAAQSSFATAAPPAIGAGIAHAVVLKSDGSVSTWGVNNSGQLGDGKRLFTKQPGKVAGLPAIASVSAGAFHVLALATDGTVWAWGGNAYGQLGDGTHERRSTPVHVAGLSNVAQVSAGANHSIALLKDGTVVEWGIKLTTQAAGDPLDRPRPVAIAGLAGIVAVSAGTAHSLAIRNDGIVFAWGSNAYGQVDGSLPQGALDAPTPRQMTNVPAVQGIAASGNTSYAIATNGWVYWWGQLQDAFPPAGVVPGASRINALNDIVAIASSGCAQNHALFIAANGKVFWYLDNKVQLAGQTLPNPFNVYQVNGIGAAAAVAAGGECGIADATAPSGGFTSSVLLKDGSIYAFGSNVWGQLGDGTSRDTIAPVGAVGIANAVGISSGNAFTVALTADGSVYAWGQNQNGELGDGVAASAPLPRATSPLPAIASQSTGTNHTLALAVEGSVWGWGSNQSGELGTGTASGGQSTPVQITGVAQVIALAAGSGHSLALKSDGTVLSWGSNASKQLGRPTLEDGTSSASSAMIPALVPNLDTVSAIAAGTGYSLALKSDGTLWLWGADIDLSAAGADLSIPRKVAGLSGIIAISAGSSAGTPHVLALKSDFSVWAFGGNFYGELGNGLVSVLGYTGAARVSGLPAITRVAAGAGHSIAIATDASVWAWGLNSDGQLGDGTNTSIALPKLVRNPGSATAVAAGTRATYIVTPDNLAQAWGGNSSGELGDGTLVSRTSPTLAVREGGEGNVTSNDWYLDASPAAGKTVSATLTPPFLLKSLADGADRAKFVKTTIKYRPADAGASGGIFVMAKIPPGTLGTLANSFVTTAALSAARLARAANSPTTARTAAAAKKIGAATDPNVYVLVQLTPAGWQTVVNNQFIPYATGTFNDALASQIILPGADTTQLPGAQFCIGYGKDALTMAANGTVRSVLSVAGGPVGVNCVPASASVIPQSGVWWNPAEGGRGFTIEHNAGRIFMAAYLYENSGRSTWYGAGPTAMSGSTFAAPLTAYSGGQTLSGAWKPPTQGTSPGNISITFADPTHATLTWPGGTIPIQRYEFISNGLSLPPTATQPQTGWWWNPIEGGRGFSVEVQNNSAFIATYMYDGFGNPVWYASGPGALPSNNYQGSWSAYTGGQTLTGPYKSPAGSTFSGILTVQFSSATAGVLTLPDGRQLPIERFSF